MNNKEKGDMERTREREREKEINNNLRVIQLEQTASKNKYVKL